jgi:hypothetical protein
MVGRTCQDAAIEEQEKLEVPLFIRSCVCGLGARGD